MRNIRQRRESLGLSQAQLCRLSGFATPRLVSWVEMIEQPFPLTRPPVSLRTLSRNRRRMDAALARIEQNPNPAPAANDGHRGGISPPGPTGETSVPRKISNTIDTHIGSRIRMRRIELDKSQDWLGGKLDLTFQQVQKYEKGANKVGGGRLHQIADVLGVEVPYFYEGLPKDGTAHSAALDPVQAVVATRHGVALVTAFAAIKDEKLQIAIVHLAQAAKAAQEAHPS